MIHFIWLVLNSEQFEDRSTFGPRRLIFQVRVLLRSSDSKYSVIVTDVSIAWAEIIIRGDWTIFFIRELEQTPQPSLS